VAHIRSLYVNVIGPIAKRIDTCLRDNLLKFHRTRLAPHVQYHSFIKCSEGLRKKSMGNQLMRTFLIVILGCMGISQTTFADSCMDCNAQCSGQFPNAQHGTVGNNDCSLDLNINSCLNTAGSYFCSCSDASGIIFQNIGPFSCGSVSSSNSDPAGGSNAPPSPMFQKKGGGNQNPPPPPPTCAHECYDDSHCGLKLSGGHIKCGDDNCCEGSWTFPQPPFPLNGNHTEIWGSF